MAYVFAPFTQESFEATYAAWLADADKGFVMSSSVEQLFDWASGRLVHQNGDSVAYGVFEEGDEVASAICEVVVTMRSESTAWVKYLHLRLRPQIDAGAQSADTGAVSKSISIFGKSITGTLRLKFAHSASKLKVYGRTNEQLHFLQALAVELGKTTKFHHIAIEGRFLVVSDKDES